MSANNKISNLIQSQVPFFVRNDHPQLVTFLEKYYEYLEQNQKTIHTLKNIKDYNDIDYTIDPYEKELYKQFLALIPDETKADKRLILKHIKDFYRSRGSEKSIRFLINILYGDIDVNFYYPKRDILKASDGKWFVEKSLKITDVKINGIANNDIVGVNNFKSRRITGNTSGASADVENVDVYYENGVLVRELKITGILKEFTDGEVLFALFEEGGTTKSITANAFSGTVVSTTIIEGGTNYQIGDTVTVEGANGSGAEIIVSRISQGNIVSISVASGGAGFQVNNSVLITGGGGAGAAAVISVVDDDGSAHPNSYNIMTSIISLEANTALNGTYTNLSSSNVNTSIANATSTFVYGNTGPIQLVLINTGGSGYAGLPTVTANSDPRINRLGILGRMIVTQGGTGYEANDKIHFVNQIGGYGVGALGNVVSVNATGSISSVEFIEMPGHIIGGSGYSQSKLPRANVISANVDATGAVITVTAILGEGEDLRPTTSDIGAIQALRIVSGGAGYTEAPTLNLTAIGDGTAQANARIITGAFTYPGRYLNDDGHVSSYNFIQDRDYYQNYSYVIRTPKPFDAYRKPLKELIHPAGMKVFGEYLFEDNADPISSQFRSSQTNSVIFKKSTYQANLGNVVINTTDHGYTGGEEIYLEFISGDTINISNGLFVVAGVANADTLFITHSNNTTNTSGNVYTGIAS